jgi:hypothetical protein
VTPKHHDCQMPRHCRASWQLSCLPYFSLLFPVNLLILPASQISSSFQVAVPSLDRILRTRPYTENDLHRRLRRLLEDFLSSVDLLIKLQPWLSSHLKMVCVRPPKPIQMTTRTCHSRFCASSLVQTRNHQPWVLDHWLLGQHGNLLLRHLWQPD